MTDTFKSYYMRATPEGKLSNIYKEGKMHIAMIPAILPRSIYRIDVTPFLPENSFTRMFVAGTEGKTL